MEFFVVLALIGIVLLLTELLLPTGGVLATIGAIGLIVGGIIALTAESGSSASSYAGPGLIALGVLSLVSFFFITPKVLEAHRRPPAWTGHEELVGARGEARTSLSPDGQVWVGGAIWRARLVDAAGPLRPGDRVIVEAIEGLTLAVRPEPPVETEAQGGTS